LSFGRSSDLYPRPYPIAAFWGKRSEIERKDDGWEWRKERRGGNEKRGWGC